MKVITNRTGLKRTFISKLRKFITQHFSSLSGTLEVVFVSDSTMRRYNRRFAGKGGTTDVLAFDMGKTYVIIISVDTARKNAIYYGEKFEDELVRYVIHGILHLMGFDHKVEHKKDRMRDMEEEKVKIWKTFYYS